MATNHIDVRINGVSLQYPEVQVEEWDEIVLDDILDADLING